MNRFKRWVPYLVLLAEVLLFHRYTILGKTVIPWDIRGYHLPHAIFVAKALRAGELPLWNPYIYCGHPFAANIQTALFYPPRFLATLLGGVSAGSMLHSLEIELILHVFLAGAFCLLLLRERGTGLIASLIGATSFQLGAFFASQAEHLGSIEGAAWLPAIWLLLLRLSRGFHWRDALLLAAAIAMSILSGFTPLTTVILISSGFLVLLLIALRKARPTLTVVFLACFAAGLLLSAVALFPAIQLTFHSVSRFRTDWMGKGGGLPLTSIYSLVWPNSFVYRGAVDITLMYLYSGALAVFGTISLFLGRQWRHVSVFLVLLLISTLFMLGESTPFGDIYVHIVPAFIRGSIYPQTWIAPFSLSLCILAAYGISAYRLTRPVGILLLLFAFGDLTWFGSNRPFNSITETVEPGVTESSFAGSPQLLNAVRYFTGLTKPPSRVDTIDDSMDWAQSAMITGVPSANGADPMVLIRYIQARLAFVKGERWGYYYQVNDPASPVLESLNVCCLLTRSRIPADQLARSAYSQVAEVPGGFLYYSSTALPRFHLVHETVEAANMSEAANWTGRPEWNPKLSAVVEGLSAMKEVSNPNDRVAIKRYRLNSVSLETDSAAPAFLVSSEANFPGWKATVDGRDARIYQTNVVFRGILLPPGKHSVEYTFSPNLLKISLLVSLLSCAGWLWSYFRFLKVPGLHDRKL